MKNGVCTSSRHGSSDRPAQPDSNTNSSAGTNSGGSSGGGSSGGGSSSRLPGELSRDQVNDGQLSKFDRLRLQGAGIIYQNDGAYDAYLRALNPLRERYSEIMTSLALESINRAMDSIVQAVNVVVQTVVNAVTDVARAVYQIVSYASSSQASLDQNRARIADGPGIDAKEFKSISSIDEVADPRARKLLHFIADDENANKLARSASANTGYENGMSDRMENRLTEYGTLQALSIVNGSVVATLYSKLFKSGQGEYTGGFNSLSALDGSKLPGYAQEMKISGQIYWANFHDHYNTGTLSSGDAGWALQNGGMTVVRNGGMLYIATGVLINKQPGVLLYQAPVSLLNFK